ncbi:MAG: hypothetical protein EBR09_14470 [Proteobacteria bacterium]|nr:hypothetical protein [Pseudomonadota bacterium]
MNILGQNVLLVHRENTKAVQIAMHVVPVHLIRILLHKLSVVFAMQDMLVKVLINALYVLLLHFRRQTLQSVPHVLIFQVLLLVVNYRATAHATPGSQEIMVKNAPCVTKAFTKIKQEVRRVLGVQQVSIQNLIW